MKFYVIWCINSDCVFKLMGVEFKQVRDILVLKVDYFSDLLLSERSVNSSRNMGGLGPPVRQAQGLSLNRTMK